LSLKFTEELEITFYASRGYPIAESVVKCKKSSLNSLDLETPSLYRDNL
jgi:hypothetical protein